jgi:hypothetical protein
MELEDKIEFLKNQLNKMIEYNDFCLQDKNIIMLSQALDELIYQYQNPIGQVIA